MVGCLVKLNWYDQAPRSSIVAHVVGSGPRSSFRQDGDVGPAFFCMSGEVVVYLAHSTSPTTTPSHYAKSVSFLKTRGQSLAPFRPYIGLKLVLPLPHVGQDLPPF